MKSKKHQTRAKRKPPHGENDNDRLFKGAFEIQEIALLHLKNFLPPSLIAHFDWDTLHLSADSYVEDELSEYFADVVYAIQLNNGLDLRACFLYEHKSELPRYSIHIQLLQYLLGIWREDINQNRALTFVLPIVVYHGRQRWETRAFSEDFPGIPEDFLPFLPLFEYQLTNISAIPDEMITSRDELRALRSVLLALKYAFDEAALKQNFQKILIFADELQNEKVVVMFFSRVFEYLQRRTVLENETIIEIINNLPKDKKDMARSTYDNIIQAGIEKGIEQGIGLGIERKAHEFIISLIRNTAFTDEKIASLVDVSVEQVRKIRSSLNLTNE